MRWLQHAGPLLCHGATSITFALWVLFGDADLLRTPGAVTVFAIGESVAQIGRVVSPPMQ